MCKSKKKKNHNSNTPSTQEQEVPETQFSGQIDITQSERASSSTQKPQQGKCTTNVLTFVNDNEKKQIYNQFAEHIAPQIKDERELENKDDQPDSPPHSPESFMNSDLSHSSSSFSAVDVPSDNGGSPFENIDKGENVSIPERSSLRGIQIKKQIQHNQHLQNHNQSHCHTIVTNKVSEQADESLLQNTKSNNLYTIVAYVLATSGVALGVATAVHLEVSAVGIAVGACCLAAAVITYYCMPKKLIENSKIEWVNINKEPLLCCK
ncbi:hypothetical protein GOY13_00180 [Wolbachia endosymbiont of Cruorifilaria tuberocauda]|uniref:TomO hydrophobic C-terminal domain-containing protein n=1 Tax=Wolbachia endosymbiont of Cruorifilaria tuberocauda TaxID=1812111 RepID=UPI00158E103D|nr:hypothetical protein [Wolbachia endosymbiont of Cruorifilaria tuberocauda]QKX01401.1 hypothetical protein GOY13_00180 [Wolbachia endosymbiont of Cruorifilaria tuberocauda]